MSSILNDIKELLGPDVCDGAFDKDIIIHVNSALAEINLLGVGPDDGFEITGESETWEELFTNEHKRKLLANVKTYIYLSVKQVFDPPSSGAVSTSIENRITKLECRIRDAADIGCERKTEDA